MPGTGIKDFSDKKVDTTDSFVLRALVGIFSVGMGIVLLLAFLQAMGLPTSLKEKDRSVVSLSYSEFASQRKISPAYVREFASSLGKFASDSSDFTMIVEKARQHSLAGDLYEEGSISFEEAESHYIHAYSLLNKLKAAQPDRVNSLLGEVLIKRATLYLNEGLLEAAQATLYELEQMGLAHDLLGE